MLSSRTTSVIPSECRRQQLHVCPLKGMVPRYYAFGDAPLGSLSMPPGSAQEGSSAYMFSPCYLEKKEQARAERSPGTAGSRGCTALVLQIPLMVIMAARLRHKPWFHILITKCKTRRLLAAGSLACLSTRAPRERGFKVQHADVSPVAHKVGCKAAFKQTKHLQVVKSTETRQWMSVVGITAGRQG